MEEKEYCLTKSGRGIVAQLVCGKLPSDIGIGCGQAAVMLALTKLEIESTHPHGKEILEWLDDHIQKYEEAAELIGG